MKEDQDLSVPRTPAGILKRKLSDACAEITGVRFCSACWKPKPYTKVKVRKGMQRGGRNICDDCQALRTPGRKVE